MSARKRTVIFDHLLQEPDKAQVRFFSRIAATMRESAWWSTVPVRDEPANVSGGGT